MDKIPLQTLKVEVKKEPEELIHELDAKIKAVNRNHKPSVPSKRVEFKDYEENEEFDVEAERSEIHLENQISTVHLVETLEKIENELKQWSHEYRDVLKLIKKLNEYDPLDQATITKSEERIEDIRKRTAEIENFKHTIVGEAKKIVLSFEKTKTIQRNRLEQSHQNFMEVTNYLLSQIEAERKLGNETNLVLRSIEKNLRETLNAYENEKAKTEIYDENLRKTKFELHKCRNELSDKESELRKSLTKIALLEKKLEESENREKDQLSENRERIQRSESRIMRSQSRLRMNHK